MSTADGDPAPAPPTRAATRRQRQLEEIDGLVARGDSVRAAGLALEHAAEFPDDLDRVAGPGPSGEAVSRRRP